MDQRTLSRRVPTLLVEDPEGVLGRADFSAFKAAGIGVSVCSGPPPGAGFDCPAVAGARCPLADAADVVLFAMTGRTDRRLVLEALRASRPDVPILVEVARRAPGADYGLPPGCTPLLMPSTVAEQIDAVRRAARSVAVR